MSVPHVSPAEDWAAFDELPAEIRRVMHEAPDPFQALAVRDQWRALEARGMSATAYASWLRRAANARR